MPKIFCRREDLVFADKPLHPRFKDIEDGVFGMLTVIGFAKKSKSHSFWYCECDCGSIITITSCSLVTGTKSCGCLQQKTVSVTSRKHGHSVNYIITPTYRAWMALRNRCMNPNNKSYADYGGRGIRVCERWDDFNNFLEDMGERPDGMSIDRKDNNGNYEPGNCRWATKKEQANNKRSNVAIMYNNQSMTISEWADVVGIDAQVIGLRLRRGWSIERSLTTSESDSRASLSRFLEYGGECLTVTQWANKMNIDAKFIFKRLYLGWDVDKIFAHIKLKHEKNHDKSCEGSQKTRKTPDHT